MKRIIQVILFIVMIILVYLITASIMQPIKFNREKELRYRMAIKRLKQIRTAQVAYKLVYKKYTGSLDSLIAFVENDSLPLSLLPMNREALGDTFKDTFREDGSIRKISVRDALFKNESVDSMGYLPYAAPLCFSLRAGYLRQGGVVVAVFEARADNHDLFMGMNHRWRNNVNREVRDQTGYAGLRVGSLTEYTNTGNWE